MQKGVILGCGNRSNAGMDTVTFRVLFLASEYVSKQVRVVPSINRPTRVNPSVF
jgi:hypothetical protein